MNWKADCDKQTRKLADIVDNSRMSASQLVDRLIPLHTYRIGVRLRAINPDTRAEFTKICISMQSALDQANLLLQNGYHIEIWSPAFLEREEGYDYVH
jgi:hypothetical protein